MMKSFKKHWSEYKYIVKTCLFTNQDVMDLMPRMSDEGEVLEIIMNIKESDGAS